MATGASTGTYSWNLNTYQIIAGALRLLGAIQTGETVGADEYADSLEALNALTKHWQSTGIHVWSEMDSVLFLQPGQFRYVIGSEQDLHGVSDHATDGWGQGTLAFAAVAGATALVLTSVVNVGVITPRQAIGIWLDAGTTFWTTVEGLTGNTVSLGAALPSAAKAGQLVVWYNNALVRPLRVMAARRYQWNVGGTPIETPMMVMSRLDYANTPNKSTPGTPTQFFYDPSISGGPQWDNIARPGQSIFYVWPAPQNNLSAVRFTAQRPLQDFTTQANLADLPQEWISTLRYNLAVELAPEYDCNPQRFEMLKLLAMEKLDTSKMWDREPEPIRFGVSAYPASRG